MDISSARTFDTEASYMSASILPSTVSTVDTATSGLHDSQFTFNRKGHACNDSVVHLNIVLMTQWTTISIVSNHVVYGMHTKLAHTVNLNSYFWECILYYITKTLINISILFKLSKIGYAIKFCVTYFYFNHVFFMLNNIYKIILCMIYQ